MKFELPNMALFIRSLTMDNRHWQGYLFRLLLLIFIVFILLGAAVNTFVSAQYTAVGLSFFSSITYTNLFFITMFGITLFSSAVTEEKEIDSLNLLLMTGIGPFSMLISKGMSKMLVAIMLIIAQLPFTLLAITLGGIGLYQILCEYITILAYIILIANVALFFSVISKKSTHAAALTLLTIIVFYISAANLPMMSTLSPYTRTGQILSTGFSGSFFPFQVWGSLIISAFFFTNSMLFFNTFSRKSNLSVPFRFFSQHGKKKRVSVFRVARTWNNAISWKEFYFSTGGFFGIILFTLLALCILAIPYGISLYYQQSLPSAEDTGGILIGISLAFLLIEGIYISSTLFSREIWGKTHSTLMLLPMSVRQIAYRKIAGGLIITIPNIILLITGLIISGNNIIPMQSPSELMAFIAICMFIFTSIIFYFHLVTYFSLLIKHGAFVIAAVAVYALMFVFLIPMMVIQAIAGMGGYKGEWIILLIMLSSLTISLFFTFFLHRMIGKKLISLAAA